MINSWPCEAGGHEGKAVDSNAHIVVYLHVRQSRH